MHEPVRRVGIVPRKGHGAALDTCRELAGWLAARGREVRVEDVLDDPGVPVLPGPALDRWAEMIVVLGGDGTLIHAASLVAGMPVPIFGVNLGSLGFMTEIPLADLHERLGAALEGDYVISPRMKLDAALYRGAGPPIFARQVLNDAVISKGALARIADLSTTVDGNLLTLFRADGVIVSTPTGSTAYSLAAGGPIVHPSVESMVICPICPHTLSQRPIVVPPDRRIEITLTSDNGEVFLTLDGQAGQSMERGDRLSITRSSDRLNLVRNARLDYYEILREKLGWGAEPP